MPRLWSGPAAGFRGRDGPAGALRHRRCRRVPVPRASAAEGTAKPGAPRRATGPLLQTARSRSARGPVPDPLRGLSSSLRRQPGPGARGSLGVLGPVGAAPARLRRRRTGDRTDARGEDRDRRDIRNALVRVDRTADFTYRHVESTNDALLWLADIVAWTAGAGGQWRARIAPLLDGWPTTRSPAPPPSGEEPGSLPQLVPWRLPYAVSMTRRQPMLRSRYCGVRSPAAYSVSWRTAGRRR